MSTPTGADYVWQCTFEDYYEKDIPPDYDYEIDKWYVVDQHGMYTDGPYDTEKEAWDAYREIHRRYQEAHRGFGPHEPTP